MRPRRASTTFANLHDKIQSDIRRLAGSTNDADDLFQDAVLFLLEMGEQFDGKTAAYIRQRCYWEAQHRLDADRTYRRYFQSMPTVIDDDGNQTELSELVPADSSSLEEAAIENETIVTALEVVEQLPVRQKQIIHLLCHGLSQKEISRKMHVSPSSVSQRLASARAKLLSATA